MNDSINRTPRPILWIGAISSAAPCFYLSWVLVNVWRDPMSWDDGNWVRLGVGLMALEFVLLHSGAFISAMIATKDKISKKLQIAAGLMLFYTLMVVGFAYSFDSIQLLWIFGAVSLSRLITALTNASEGAQTMMARSALGIILYMAAVFGTIMLPIPELGISTEILNEVYPGRGGGVWEREPERAIAGAAVYFAALGLVELFILGPPREGKDKNSEELK
ncbi:MAG: hypothetical protein GKR91_18520 [Pseudomonadales bacterium]|nr:hypothetical protein [Pseudomonadales bacterium]